ncbi:LysE family translocator [Gammaproteobacteria bacterium]|nr:LysE family translocator [Gammaproteobacteria bacterium]
MFSIEFLSTALALIATPGPAKWLLMSLSSTQGMGAGLRFSIGIYISDVLLVLMVSIGLGAAIMSVPQLAEGIALIGVVFLAYFSYRFAMKAYHGPGSEKNELASPRPNLVVMGFLVNSFNPLALAFYVALLPNLIAGSGYQVVFHSLLQIGLSLVTIFLVAHSLLVFLATVVKHDEINPLWYRFSNLVVCLVLIGLCVKLIANA